MTHLKRINAPKSWPIERKVNKFIVKPLPGPHKLKESMPLSVILREILKIGKKKRDIKLILNNKNILINNKVRNDFRFPVGIFDTITISELNKNYKVMYNKKGKITLEEVNKEEKDYKIYKITGKSILKKGKIQINLYNGSNIIVEKDIFKVRDSVVLKEKKIVKHLKFEKGSLIYLIGGKHIGSKGKIVEVKKYPGIAKDVLVFNTDEKTHETLADYAYVIEK